MSLDSIVGAGTKGNQMGNLMKLKLIALSILLSVASISYSEHHEEGEKASKERVDKNAKVCKRLEVPGSHIKKRICKSQRYWDKLTRDSQNLSQEMSSRQG